MEYDEHLKIYKMLQKFVSDHEAANFNRIVDYKLPLGLTKNEYTAALLVLVKNIPRSHYAKECGVKEWAIEMRLKRAAKKLQCWNVIQLKEEILRIEKHMNYGREILK